MNKIVRTLVPVILAIIFIAGCSEGNVTGNAEGAAEVITVVDVLDREVEIEGTVDEVYYGFYYENLLAVAGPDIFKKVKATSLYDTEGYFLSLSEMYREHVEGYADMVDIGSTLQDNFDVEKLLEVDVDVVILGAYQYDMLGDSISVIENAGIPVVVIDYTTGSMELQVESTEILGKVFGKEDRANELIDNYQSNYREIEERLEASSVKPKIFAEFHTTISSYKDIGTSGGEGSFLGNYLEKSGGDNIMVGFMEDSNKPTIDPEYLLEEDPSYLVFVGGESNGASKEGIILGHQITAEELVDSAKGILKNRPGWSELEAVKNNQIYVIDDAIARTLADYTIVQYLAKAMYPEEMTGIDPLENLKQYYGEFLPTLPLEGAFFYQLHADEIQ
ncbi:ABC transporter substrate-binding protein [Gracilibacillus kekensis]|uniref:ABC-type Fe3+-hydroxamate transport system, substrate-binding protein n=1 Tax=Gracilibacillus kekensis TaxID=1027249 RepID=A0A1M7LGG7_9BACI|nr:ABC transporter substrate-binding protein [Gracilibacillus kekensis]SHM77074.1 ABC-type Fe3+-hydroxamate transport system, substrate-binding protein [Gracilibacillus kekensis]